MQDLKKLAQKCQQIMKLMKEIPLALLEPLMSLDETLQPSVLFEVLMLHCLATSDIAQSCKTPVHPIKHTGTATTIKETNM